MALFCVFVSIETVTQNQTKTSSDLTGRTHNNATQQQQYLRRLRTLPSGPLLSRDPLGAPGQTRLSVYISLPTGPVSPVGNRMNTVMLKPSGAPTGAIRRRRGRRQAHYKCLTPAQHLLRYGPPRRAPLPKVRLPPGNPQTSVGCLMATHTSPTRGLQHHVALASRHNRGDQAQRPTP